MKVDNEVHGNAKDNKDIKLSKIFCENWQK